MRPLDLKCKEAAKILEDVLPLVPLYFEVKCPRCGDEEASIVLNHGTDWPAFQSYYSCTGCGLMREVTRRHPQHESSPSVR